MKSAAATASRNAGVRVVLCAGILMLAGAIDTARANENRSASPAAASLKDAAERTCRAFGPDYTSVGDTGLCAKIGGGILLSTAKEFTDRDIVMTGQRIPTLFNNGAGAPIVFYQLEDVGQQTKSPTAAAYAWAQMMLQAYHGTDLLRGFVRIAADARTRYTHDGEVIFDLRRIENSYYYGAIDEAWVQWNSFKVGIQPSMFGFNRLPTVVTPGYTSTVTTLGASYTLGLSRNASLSFALEDPTRRMMSDGILARPGRGEIPDLVAMARIATPSTLFHISGAIRHLNDHVVRDFTGEGDEKSVWGWAWSAGLQHRVKWEDILGPDALGVYGRLGLTVAQASGAPAYLGIPFFAPDYITAGDGRIFNSQGWSAVGSYEHMLTPRVKLNLTASYFDISMHSRGEPLIPQEEPGPPLVPDLDFEVDVRGAVFQAGLEYAPRPDMVIGIEGGYTTTMAKGRYIGIPGDKVSVGFPHVGVYLRKSF